MLPNALVEEPRDHASLISNGKEALYHSEAKVGLRLGRRVCSCNSYRDQPAEPQNVLVHIIIIIMSHLLYSGLDGVFQLSAGTKTIS